MYSGLYCLRSLLIVCSPSRALYACGSTLARGLVFGVNYSPSVASTSLAPAPVVNGAGAGWITLRDQPGPRWGLRCPATTIGADPGCDIVFTGLAPRHAEIRCENDRRILYDLSGGQTWINGRRITTANLLKDSFIVRLSTVEFIFIGA